VPKLVDHVQRQNEIGAAAEVALIDEGWDGVTLRGVGSRTGWSTGALRHYFPTQQSLRSYLAARVAERLTATVGARIADADAEHQGGARVAAIVEQLLPLDAERRREYALWAALVEWERSRPPGEHSNLWDDQRGLYRRCVALLAEPSGPDRVDPDSAGRWASYLHALIDGLAAQMIQTPARVSVDDARTIVRGFVEDATRALIRT
jgi:AcrR family transcriptional regulator